MHCRYYGQQQKKQKCSLNDLAKWLCERPAELPRLGQKKGKIARGYDADLVAWNPDLEFVVSEDIILHRHKVTPYLGNTLYGVVTHTWLKGEKVYEHGKFLHLNKGSLINHE